MNGQSQLEQRIYALETATEDLAKHIGDGKSITLDEVDSICNSAIQVGEKLKSVVSVIKMELKRRVDEIAQRHDRIVSNG